MESLRHGHYLELYLRQFDNHQDNQEAQKHPKNGYFEDYKCLDHIIVTKFLQVIPHYNLSDVGITED